MGPPIFFSVLSLLLVVHNVSAAGNGIIGYGLSLYQDQCCQACYDSLSALYLNCTTFTNMTSGTGMGGMDMDMGAMDMAMMPETSSECYASNVPWLQTMAYCIKSNCDAHGYPADQQPACFSKHAVAGASTPGFQESLPATAPTTELEADAMWLNVTSLVNGDLYYSTYGTEAEFARSEYIHSRYALILYLITIGFIIGAGVFAQARGTFFGFQKALSTSRLWAKLQQFIFLPALFGSRRLQPLPGNIGYVPGRTLSIFIGLYIVMNIILCSVSFRSFQPNIFWHTTHAELCEYVGNRTGVLSLVNLSMAILFAGRNNILILLTGWSQTTFLILHRWFATMATLQAVVHSIVYTLQFFEPGQGGAAYAAKVKETFYWVGIMATIAMCLAAGLAILPIRTALYETFLITHIALVIMTLVTCWYHLVPHFGYDFGYEVWLYICFAFWFFDRLVRVLRMAYYNQIGSSMGVVEAVPGCDVLQVTVFPRVWSFGPGQHSFLYIPDSSLYLPGLAAKFWENHPFSVAGWKVHGYTPIAASPPTSPLDDTEKGKNLDDINIVSVASSSEASSPPSTRQQPINSQQTHPQDYTSIKFLMRVQKGMTATLQRRVLASRDAYAEVAMYTEGPYGGHKATLNPFLNADTILLLIGGIGITTALGYVQEYTSARLQKVESSGKKNKIMNKATRLILAWSTREMALIEHVKSNFLDQQHRAAGVEYLFWCTGSNDSAGHKSESAGHGNEPSSLSARAAMLGVSTERMNVRSVMRSYAETGHQTTVLSCGPGNMIDEVAREVVSCVKDGLRVDLVEEAFGW